MNKTEQLDIQLRAHVENLAAFAEMQAQMKALGVEADALSVKTLKSGELSVRGNVAGNAAQLGSLSSRLEAAGAQMSGFRMSTLAAADAAEKHANGMKHLEEAVHHGAVTWGLYGENVEGASRKLGGIQGLLGGGLGMGIAGMAGAAVLGFGIEAGKAAIENAEKQERAQELLRQSAEVTGQSYSKLALASENWIHSNSAFVKDQYEATEAMALFTRAGNDQATVQKAMSTALDLSVLKHMSLLDASRVVQLAMMGNSRAVKELGIDLKSLSSDDAVTETATKELDRALKNQESSAARLTVANQALRDMEDGLHGKRTLSQLDLDHLHEKQAAAAKAAQEMAAANAAVTKAQTDLGSSQARGKVILGELGDTVKDARDGTTELEKAQYKLNIQWQDFTARHGPGVTHWLATIKTTAADTLLGLSDLDKWLLAHHIDPMDPATPVRVAAGAAGAAVHAGSAAEGRFAHTNTAPKLQEEYDKLAKNVGALQQAAENAGPPMFGISERLDAAAAASARAGDGMRYLREGLDTNGIASSQAAHEVAKLTAHEDALQRAMGTATGKFDDWSGSLRLASQAAEEHQKSLRDTEWAATMAALSVDTVRESISLASQERLDIHVDAENAKNVLDDVLVKIQTIQNTAAQGAVLPVGISGDMKHLTLGHGNLAFDLGGFQSP